MNVREWWEKMSLEILILKAYLYSIGFIDAIKIVWDMIGITWLIIKLVHNVTNVISWLKLFKKLHALIKSIKGYMSKNYKGA